MAPSTFTQRPKIQQRRLDERGWKLHIMLLRPWLSVCRLWILFHCQVCASALGSSSSTSMWDFYHSSCFILFSPSSYHCLFSPYFLLNLPLTPISHLFSLFLLLGLSFSTASTRTCGVNKVQQRIHLFLLSFHSVIHSFVLKGQVVWTLAVYATQCCGFTCLTKGLFIQFLTSI